MGQISDETLMERYSGGDQRAFEQLFERYDARTYAYFLRRTGSKAGAWDLYQDLFLRLHRFRSSYDPQQAFAPWFFQIARRVLIDQNRREFRKREVQLKDEAKIARECDAEKKMIHLQRAVRALERLSPIESRVLLAAKVEGFCYSEVAEATGKSVAAVKQIASRALRRLRDSEDLCG